MYERDDENRAISGGSWVKEEGTYVKDIGKEKNHKT
jgi:hypothetical protein